jgi:anion-transporting  ArsA/GET3 family ATPase
VLLVSTDPASNLDEVLGVKLSSAPTSVPLVPRLSALNIDPVKAAQAYRERMVGPYRGVLPAAAVKSIEEQLSGACTVEIAAFDEFSKLLGDPQATAEFDHVIFDTAPTGHTLRLLSCPQPGRASSTATSAAPRAWGRCRASTRRRRCTPRRTPRSVLLSKPPWCWWLALTAPR